MLTTIRDIYEYIDTFAPFKTQCSWDNSGLVIGDMNSEVTRIGFALDATSESISDAEANKCDLIVTHHPIIFNAVRTLDSHDSAYKAIKAGIPVLCAHTCLDKGNPGVNTVLAEIVGLKNITAFETGTDADMCRIGDIEPINAKDYSKFISEKLGSQITYTDSGEVITRVAVCGGAGAEFLFEAKKLGAQAFITGEIRHHEYLAANEMGISVFSAGHFETENPVIPVLKNIIQEKFGLDCIILKQACPTLYTGA